MKFLVDQNLPPLLAGWLRERGHDADHVRDLGLANSSDHEIVRRALELGAVLVSKDADFARTHAVPVVWVRLGNTTNQALTAAFGVIWQSVEAALHANETIIEIREPL